MWNHGADANTMEDSTRTEGEMQTGLEEHSARLSFREPDGNLLMLS